MTLANLYDSIISEECSIERASEIMTSKEAREVIEKYLERDKNDNITPYSHDELHEIDLLCKISQYIYNNSGNETGMTDSEYDTLYSILIDNGGNDDTSAPVTSTGDTVSHVYSTLRGTLKKVYYLDNTEERTNKSRASLDEWKKSMEMKIYQKTGQVVNLDNEEIYVFPKFDGVSAIFEIDANGNIERVLTRGNTETNEAKNIKQHFSFMSKQYSTEFPGEPYGLKTEIMVNNSDLEYYNEKYKTNYKNTRSIVSAILNSDSYDPEKSALLQVIPLRVGGLDGSQKLSGRAYEYPYIKCKLKERDVIREFAMHHKFVKKNELRCDGAVIYIINPELQKILGRENNKNNFEVAYKFTEETAFTKIKDIVYTVGLFGRISPVAQIEPVKLKGNTINNVSLGSIGRVRTLNLGKNDTVKILYDIIPYLTIDNECKRSDKPRFELPTSCPECGGEVEYSETGESCTCANKKCPCRIKGKILNYLIKMNIDNISYAIIDKLYEYGFVKSIPDLYKIEKNIKDIIKIDGFGAVSVGSWIDELNAHMDVFDYELLASIGIPGYSKKKFFVIMQEYDLDEFLDIVDNAIISKLTPIKGISEKGAVKLLEGVHANMKLIEKLRKILNVKTTKNNIINISRFSVVFTGFRDKDKEKFILSHGGEVTENVTKKTSFVIVPSYDYKSGKIDKANKYGIPIILVNDMEDAIESYLS